MRKSDSAAQCTRHSPVIDTAVQIGHRCARGPYIRSALATIKGNINQKTSKGKLSYTISITLTLKIGGLTKNFFATAVVFYTTVCQIGNFIVAFLFEFEAIFKKVLTCALWA
jgi:hypothetical protein